MATAWPSWFWECCFREELEGEVKYCRLDQAVLLGLLCWQRLSRGAFRVMRPVSNLLEASSDGK